MAMRFPLALLLMLAAALAVAAAEPESRPSVSLLLDQPAWLHSGRCVVYAENSPGWAGSAPEYFVRGRVLSTRVEERRLAVCPVVPGKAVDHYSREEFNRLALAAPCVSAESLRRDVRLGLVRLRVDQWETPHARRAENGGRLYRGMFIDQKLSEGSEIELEADLLASCPD